MTQEQLNRRLFKAVQADDIEGVKKAIEDGADINAKNEYGYTVFYYAYNYRK